VIEATSLGDVLLQCGVLVVLGAFLTVIVHVLRFRPRAPVISNPRSSAIWALFAVGVGWTLVIALLLLTAGNTTVSSASLMPISLFLGYVMMRTQSIVAPGLLHTAINWLDL
jgi:hypothetical protein